MQPVNLIIQLSELLENYNDGNSAFCPYVIIQLSELLENYNKFFLNWGRS